MLRFTEGSTLGPSRKGNLQTQTMNRLANENGTVKKSPEVANGISSRHLRLLSLMVEIEVVASEPQAFLVPFEFAWWLFPLR